MCINFTKNPIKPIIANPMAVATAIFWDSKMSNKIIYTVFYRKFTYSQAAKGNKTTIPIFQTSNNCMYASSQTYKYLSNLALCNA